MITAREWLIAFLLTEAIEFPVYWIASRNRPLASRLAYALGGSAITHPILWFCFPWETYPYIPLALLGETFVIVTEGAWGKLWRIPRPWLISFIANLTSVLVGIPIRWYFF